VAERFGFSGKIKQLHVKKMIGLRARCFYKNLDFEQKQV
jgi:hypothetical protein